MRQKVTCKVNHYPVEFVIDKAPVLWWSDANQYASNV
jgi:hypothetical protein